jgi:hypothetical protein
MADTIPHSWRFVKAKDISDGAIDFDALDVRSTDDDSLGNVRGFIVDGAAERLHYVVVDSGGWFSGGSYLIPPAYTRLDAENGVLWTELTRNVISRFPQFDEDLVSTLSRDQLWAIERRIIAAYGDDPGVVAPSTDWPREKWPQYEQPPWWSYRRSLSPTQLPAAGVSDAEPRSGEAVGHRDVVRRDVDDARLGDERADAVRRAQPGDMLGIERAGETTSLGDTAADEDRRRRAAEEDFSDIRDETNEGLRDHGIAPDRPRRPER